METSGTTKHDVKTIAIAILTLALVFSILCIVFRKTVFTDDQAEINSLHQTNTQLLAKNDSIKMVNLKLDHQIDSINIAISEDQKKLTKAQSKINNLNKEKNDIVKKVSNLSDSAVAIDLSKLISTEHKSQSNRSK